MPEVQRPNGTARQRHRHAREHLRTPEVQRLNGTAWQRHRHAREHLWLPEVDVTVAGDDAAVALQTTHAGSQVAPGVTNLGWTTVAVKHSPASKGKVVTITVAAPAAAR